VSLKMLELVINIVCGYASFNLRHLTYELAFLANDPDNALIHASKRGEYMYARLLVYFADVHCCSEQPLYGAALNGHVNIAEMLIDCGADVLARDGILLPGAAYKGHAAVVKLLIQHKADVSSGNNLALRHAIDEGHTAVVQTLLQHGADISVHKDPLVLISRRTRILWC
jgi:ankyrin repeat protein